jgi:transcriptional regulator with XRE-family HTH domain
VIKRRENKMLAKRLRELREENEYTQKDIADKIGLTKSAYGYYERGKSVPDAQTLVQLSKIFDVTTDYLLGLSDDKKPIEDITERQKKAIRLTDQLTDEQFESILEMVLSFKKD